jgi:hypothetical protein
MDITNLLDSVKPGNTASVFAPTAGGKTTIACWLASVMALRGEKVLYVCDKVELPCVTARFASRALGQPLDACLNLRPRGYFDNVIVSTNYEDGTVVGPRAFLCWTPPTMVIIDSLLIQQQGFEEWRSWLKERGLIGVFFQQAAPYSTQDRATSEVQTADTHTIVVGQRDPSGVAEISVNGVSKGRWMIDGRFVTIYPVGK